MGYPHIQKIFYSCLVSKSNVFCGPYRCVLQVIFSLKKKKKSPALISVALIFLAWILDALLKRNIQDFSSVKNNEIYAY